MISIILEKKHVLEAIRREASRLGMRLWYEALVECLGNQKCRERLDGILWEYMSGEYGR